jgi:hypothetical protein
MQLEVPPSALVRRGGGRARPERGGFGSPDSLLSSLPYCVTSTCSTCTLTRSSPSYEVDEGETKEGSVLASAEDESEQTAAATMATTPPTVALA